MSYEYYIILYEDFMKKKSAIVLFSGGQDSTVCLLWACNHFNKVETIGFDYGQRHQVELDCRLKIIDSLKNNFIGLNKILGVDHVINLKTLGDISETSLTREKKIEIEENGMPNTFVPGRNLAFLVMAGALGWRRNIFNLVGGMCETDYSGYPDCRKATLNAQEKALSLGLDIDANIHTPLMHMNKKNIWKFAYDLGGQKFINIIKELTHTCYLGERTKLNSWGYGCGKCPACLLRIKGYEEWINS